MPLKEPPKVSFTLIERSLCRLNILRYIAVYHLGHPKMSAVCQQVESLRFCTCRFHSRPFQIFLSQLGIRSYFCLFSNRLYGRGSIDWFLSSCDIGNPRQVIIQHECLPSNMYRNTYCCLIQFISTTAQGLWCTIKNRLVFPGHCILDVIPEPEAFSGR